VVVNSGTNSTPATYTIASSTDTTITITADAGTSDESDYDIDLTSSSATNAYGPKLEGGQMYRVEWNATVPNVGPIAIDYLVTVRARSSRPS
jgi:hypothetical protein